MTVLDERGEPVVVERVGGPGRGLPRCCLASGWKGGVDRYAAGWTAQQAVSRWARREFLPLRQLSPDEARRLLAEGREAQAEMRRRLRSMEDVRDVPSDERRARAPLSPDAAAARKPLPPEQLVNALNDRVHHDIGRARAARVHRPSDERPGERPEEEEE